jgi:maleate isomerase
VGVIEALEADLDRPVLSANQVLLWAALVTAGADPAMIDGYGRVFTTQHRSTMSERVHP